MTERKTDRRRWRRRIANLLILGGVLVILYPVGTWAVTWWEQRGLERALVEANPILGESAGVLLEDDPVRVPVDFGDVRAEAQTIKEKGREAERVALTRELSQAAADFAAEIGDSGGAALGRLTIPKIGVDVIVIQGTGRGDLREGPGHWPETPMPGAGGNFVVSGHRTTYGAPFFKLDKLGEGDLIELTTPYAALRYEVTSSVIVFPTQVDVVAQRGLEEISLATCHPIYSAKQRLVVQARLIAFKLLDQAAPAASS